MFLHFEENQKMIKKWIKMLLIVSLFIPLNMGWFGIPGEAASSEKQLRFYVVMHVGATHPFCQCIMKGVQDASEELGVEAHFVGPATYSIKEQIDLLEGIIATRPDGIATSIPTAEAFDEVLRKAINMGIPVIAIDMEDPRPDRIPYLTFVGWDNYGIGVATANKVLDDLQFTPHHVLIGIHQAGHVGLELRAQGLTDVFKKRIPDVVIDKLHTTEDMAKGVSVYESFLKANPDVDMIFGAGGTSTHPAIQVLEEKGLVDKILLVGADLSSPMLEAIKRGTQKFTSDTQQYLWGWLPVVLLYKYSQYGLMPVNPIYTGPSIIDSSNLDEVIDLVKQGIR